MQDQNSANAERVIDTVGCSEEEAARLRLLFRMGAAKFSSRWRFSDSEPPDLLLVDPETALGAAAREVARQSGHVCISIVDLGVEDGPDWALRRPLKLDAIVRMVNTLCAPVVSPAASAPPVKLVAQDENFFELDLGEAPPKPVIDDGLPGVVMPNIVRGLGAHDVEGLFRREPGSDSVSALLPQRLAEDTAIEFTDSPTARTSARMGGAAERMVGHAAGEAPNIDPSLRRSAKADTRAHPLLDYLNQSILGAPASIELAGLPRLVLDPLNQTYHAMADLSALELYCLQDLPRAAFIPLTSSELTEVRVMMPAKPWVRLRWLARYLVSEGRLSSQLDPGGQFRLEQAIELARDYPTAYRVSTAMLGEMRPLHEIAKRAEASMTEVINVVNAYESVNLLQAQLRDRFR